MLNPAFWWLLAVKFLAFWKLWPRSWGTNTLLVPQPKSWGPVFPGPYGCCAYVRNMISATRTVQWPVDAHSDDVSFCAVYTGCGWKTYQDENCNFSEITKRFFTNFCRYFWKFACLWQCYDSTHRCRNSKDWSRKEHSFANNIVSQHLAVCPCLLPFSATWQLAKIVPSISILSILYRQWNLTIRPVLHNSFLRLICLYLLLK